MSDMVTMHVVSDLRELKKALNIVLMQIKNKKPYLPDEDFIDLRLIFSELLSNAIIHGNRCDIHKKVCVIIEFTDEEIISEIMDEGSGFNYTEILKPSNPDKDFLSETGRGIKLVSALTDELMFNNKGNEIRFSKKLVHMFSEDKSACIHYSKKLSASAV